MTPAHGEGGPQPHLTAVLRPLTAPSRAIRGSGYPNTCSGSVAPLPRTCIMLTVLPGSGRESGSGSGFSGTHTIVRDRGCRGINRANRANAIPGVNR